MINYYQPWYFSFLGTKRHAPRPGVKRYYYHSFEDGLWDLLENRFPHGALFLVPDFYCADVLDNIVSHGSRFVRYPLDENFQIDGRSFERYVKRYRPDVAVVFHACGIASRLMRQTGWTELLGENALVLEDCVHRFLDQNEVKLIAENHVVMDSLRKVSPCPGAFMYGSAKTLSFKQAHAPLLSGYFLSSFLLYIIFRATLEFGFLVNSGKTVSFAHRKLLKAHDNIIGDSKTPHRGTKFFRTLAELMDVGKVKKLKERQVRLYAKLLAPLYENDFLHKVAIPETDFRELHVYPLVFTRPPMPELEEYLGKNNIAVWFKFPDSEWSKNRSVLFLPLGPQMREKEITRLAQTVREFVLQLSENK